MLERFVLIMCAVDRVSGSGGLIFHFADFAVYLAADRVMPGLVGFMPAMLRDDRVLGAFRLSLYLVGFLVDFLPELGDLDGDVFLFHGLGLRHRRDRCARWKS